MAVFHSRRPVMDKINKLCARLSLSDEQFETLSRRAEVELRENRSLYMTKVIVLALLGYAFILAVVTLLLLTLYWLIMALIHAHIHGAGYKILALVLVPLWMIGKSLWVTVPEPKGIVANRKDSPQLFALIDELSEKLHTRVDKVLLDEQFNASVVQIPRLGALGFHKNILTLGLPLMLSQRPLPFKAILAHELGHLSGNHSKSRAWIYNLRMRWAQLLNSIGEAGDIFFILFLIFFSWFSPRFNSYTLALARAHELEADAEAARIAGVDNFSESMLLLPVYERFQSEKVWPELGEEVKVETAPPPEIFTRLCGKTAAYSCTTDDLKVTIKEALQEKGSGYDTHPPLKVRLTEGYFEPIIKLDESLSLPAEMLNRVSEPITTENSAAAVYLGREVLDQTLAQIDKDWQSRTELSWQQEHERLQEVQKALTALEEQAQSKELTLAELKSRAFYIGEVKDTQAAIAAYSDIVDKFPSDAAARYSLGMMLLKDDFDHGLEHLKAATISNRALLALACPIILPLLKAKGRHDEAAHYETNLDEYYKIAELAVKERQSVSAESLLEPHGMEEDEVEYLNNVFRELPNIHAAYLVRKVVHHLPECPYLVVALDIKPQLGSVNPLEEIAALARWLVDNLQLRYEFCVSTFGMGTAKLKKNIEAVEGSLIYRKDA